MTMFERLITQPGRNSQFCRRSIRAFMWQYREPVFFTSVDDRLLFGHAVCFLWLTNSVMTINVKIQNLIAVCKFPALCNGLMYCPVLYMQRHWSLYASVWPYKVTSISRILMFVLLCRVTQKTGTFEKPNKNWRNSRKKIIDRNWTIKTCLLRGSNPHYQCLKITSCRWRPPPRMHYFTATTHFKSSRSFVSPCVCCILCRMRRSRILQSMQHTQGDTKERELLKCVVAVKECIRGGGRHLQDVIFKHW